MLRDFLPGDIDRVMRLWLDTNTAAHSFVDSGYWLESFEAVKLALPKADVSVYEQDGDIRAFIGLTEGYIAGLFVSGDFQSKGLGKLLLDHAKEKHAVLTLNVYKKNTRAIRFYIREGFTVSGEQTDENTGEKEYTMTWNGRKL